MATLNANQGVMQTNPVGYNRNPGIPSADRGFFGQIFKPADIATEDWLRAEQSSDNQLQRDLYMQGLANEFTAEQNRLAYERNSLEAQKQRDYDERMSNTQYQRAVADLKKAGINPVMAVSQGGNSWQGGTSAGSNAQGSSSSRSGRGSDSRGFVDSSIGNLLSDALQLGAGLIASKIGAGKKFKVGF